MSTLRAGRGCRWRPLLGAGLLLLAGCAGSGEARPSAPATMLAGSSAPRPVPLPTDPPPPVSTPLAPAPAAPPVLVLQGGGLGVLSDDGAGQDLPFGAPGDAVQAAVEQALGPGVPAALAACPGWTALDVDGFRVLLDAGVFVGWVDTGADDRQLTTSDGVGLGSRLEELQSALPDVAVTPAPQGATWVSGAGLAGRLSGLEPSAVVTEVAGGRSCG